MIWDDCHECWFVGVKPGAVVQTTGALENTPKAIFYHPWQTPQRYTEEEIKTKPLPSFKSVKKCTCGSGPSDPTHYEWCDINYKEEDELPF